MGMPSPRPWASYAISSAGVRTVSVSSMADESYTRDGARGQAVRGHGGVLAAQVELTARRRDDARGQHEALEQRARDHEIESHPLGVLFQSRGGIEDVADEDDLLPEIAELTGRHRTTVHAAGKRRHDAEVATVAPRLAGDGVAHGEEAAHAIGRAHARRQIPGHD